jgi:hypothetical protein
MVASALDFRIDRFAIGCVHDNEGGGLQTLLSLASHPLDLVRRLIDSFPPPTSTRDKPEEFGLEKAILQASDMLVCQCSKTALCQIFLITGNAKTMLSLPPIDGRVRLHTISLGPQLCLYGSKSPHGWHIFSEIDPDNLGITETVLVNKIRRVSAHLHTGIDSGVLTDLRLCLVPGEGCQIESIFGETHCPSLRPGEKWIIWVQIRVSAGSPKRIMTCNSQARERNTFTDQTIDDLIAQLHQMLGYSPEGSEHTIVTAFLGYKHSLLPKSNTIRVSGCCQIVRASQKNSGCVRHSPTEMSV